MFATLKTHIKHVSNLVQFCAKNFVNNHFYWNNIAIFYSEIKNYDTLISEIINLKSNCLYVNIKTDTPTLATSILKKPLWSPRVYMFVLVYL